MRLPKAVVAFSAFAFLAGTLGSTTLAPAALAQTAAKSSVASPHKQTQGLSDAAKSALSRQLTASVARGDTPGVVALVVGSDGVLYKGAAGKLDVAHNVAMPVNAIFSIASMTKPVTSVAIMMLFEQGKLKLDDPVSKYLSGLRQSAGHHEIQ